MNENSVPMTETKKEKQLFRSDNMRKEAIYWILYYVQTKSF